MYTLKWQGNSVSILDQRKLPLKEIYNNYENFIGVANSIKDMEVRGAPAIGVTAAMGIALAARNIQAKNFEEFKKELESVYELFASTRPTAVNLFWAIERMKKIANGLSSIAASGSTTPFTRSKPGLFPNSSLSVKRICNPRQIPRKGFPFSIDLRMGSTKFSFFRLCIQSLNAPTPGSTRE